MKLLLILILFLPFSSAIQITEIESNPSGTDAGNEWVEFYSEEQINLADYIFQNNDEDTLNITGIFKGFYLYTFPKQALDNSNESISIFQNNSILFETPLFDDYKNNGQTYSFCNEEWVFQIATPLKENCPPKEEEVYSEEIIQKQNESEEVLFEEIKKEERTTKENVTIYNKTIIPSEPIYLNTKTIKKDNSTNILGEQNYAKYSLMVFCLILLILFTIKPRKKKNEWN